MADLGNGWFWPVTTAMTENELKALVASEIRDSVGYIGGKIATARQKAHQYYLGRAVGDLAPPEVDGRSAVVSTDVRDTVESMLPQLMAKFVGGDRVVEFEPTKPGDEEKADLCTEYLNYLFFKKANGHGITLTWFKDALAQKVGVVKCWWDTRSEEKREEYRGLSKFELAQLLDDPEVEPKEQKSYPDEEDAKQRQQVIEQLTAQLPKMPPEQAIAAQQHITAIQAQPPEMLFDLVVKRKPTSGKIAIENVPPEEFLISRRAKSIAEARFVGHRVLRTMSELKSMGYKRLDQLGNDESGQWLSGETTERRILDDDYLMPDGDVSMDESQRRIWVVEGYIRADYDGDGIAELRKVVYAGNELLEESVVDVAPFVAICPIPLPHRFWGLSVADLAMEAQKTKTSILRAVLDNMYLQVNGRYFAEEGLVNLDDLLSSRPGGVVRIKRQGAVGRLDQAAGDTAAGMSMLEHMEGVLESSTGWTRYSQGNDARSLQGTATGMNIVTNKDDMRLDLIARNFAQGFTELFKLMLKLVCQYQDKWAQIRLSGKWIEIDPREWINQFDVEINIGLGVGNKDQKLQHLMALLQVQAQVLPMGVANPKNVYEGAVELAKLQGFKSPDKFFTDPAQHPMPPQPHPEQIKAQAQLQIEQVKAQTQTAIEQGKVQANIAIERDKMAMQAQVDQHRQQMEAGQQQLKAQAQAELEAYKINLESQREQARAQHEAALEQLRIQAENQRAQLDSETKIAVARMAHEGRMQEIGAQAHLHQQSAQQAAQQTVQPDTREMLKAVLQPTVPKPKEAPKEHKQENEVSQKLASTVSELQKQIAAMQQSRSSPVRFIRGKDGRAEGFDVGGVVRKIKRGADGRMSHVE
ncbi:MAG: hypothetical protein RL758_258 [Pseudomonadota bacterium]|jgi:hypothetical protein